MRIRGIIWTKEYVQNIVGITGIVYLTLFKKIKNKRIEYLTVENLNLFLQRETAVVLTSSPPCNGSAVGSRC